MVEIDAQRVVIVPQTASKDRINAARYAVELSLRRGNMRSGPAGPA